MIIGATSMNHQDDVRQLGSPAPRMRVYYRSERRPRRSWRPQTESLEGRQLLSSVVLHPTDLAAVSSVPGSGKRVAAAIHTSQPPATGHRVAAPHSAIVSAVTARENTPPKFVKKARARPSPVTGTSVTLAALGTDNGGAANVRYTWAATALPAGAPAPVFSINASNAAKNTTAMLSAAGTYRFTVSIADTAGLTAISTVNVLVKQSLTSVTISPASITVTVGGTQQFVATAKDQFGHALASQPKVTWASSGGKVTSLGLFTAPGTTGNLTVTAAVVGSSSRGSTSVTVIPPNTPPQVLTAASAQPNPVTGTTAALSVLATDDGGESNLTYTWTTTARPTGAPVPTFSANGSNAAKATTVTFASAGSYTFKVTVADLGGLSATSVVNVVVNQTLTAIVVTPGSAALSAGQTQQFTAVAQDQFAQNMAAQPAFTWTATVGTITTAGFYTAPQASAVATVTAFAGSLTGTATATTTNEAPQVVMAASAQPNPVTGTTVALSVLATDDGGEPNLTYTWTTTALPTGAPVPTFTANGSNAAKATTVTFASAGSYTFKVTVADLGGLSATSVVNVVVNQTLTAIVVTPGNVTLGGGQTQQFTAVAKDQFAQNMATQPAFTWTATVGTITTAGFYAAPQFSAIAPVTATAGTVTGTATVACNPSFGDPQIQSLVQTLDADGSLDRADMMQILFSVGNEDGVVDATDFNDLKTILADASIFHIPGYVQVLAGDVINGNPANASYQGTLLGNLTAGSSATTLHLLVDKWFLGTDHPATTYAYQSFAGSLFVNNPTYTDMQQGNLGDCYLIASLGALAKSSVKAIQNMFIDNGDNTWTVRFYVGGTTTPDYVTVDRYL